MSKIVVIHMKLAQIKKRASSIGLKEFYTQARNSYLSQNGFDEEPVIEGKNDRADSLARINDPRISARISEVKTAYRRLRADDIGTAEFYRISGTEFSTNDPLIHKK